MDDAAFVACDALARPVNEHLRATTPLGRRLEEVAGSGAVPPSIAGELPGVGAAIVTTAGALEAKLLIHAVVMTRDERVTPSGVRRAMTSVLQRANDWGLRHVAVMPLGLGAGNLDIDASARAMLDAIAAWERSGTARAPLHITFVVETEDERLAFPRLAGDAS